MAGIAGKGKLGALMKAKMGDMHMMEGGKPMKGKKHPPMPMKGMKPMKGKGKKKGSREDMGALSAFRSY